MSTKTDTDEGREGRSAIMWARNLVNRDDGTGPEGARLTGHSQDGEVRSKRRYQKAVRTGNRTRAAGVDVVA